jgi:hypothetical protein
MRCARASLTAVAGWFTVLAERQSRIRCDPAARTSELL